VDDLYLSTGSRPRNFCLIINASRISDDVAWLEKQLAAHPQKASITMKNASDDLGAVAVQGPKVRGLIDTCFTAPPNQAS